MSEQYVLITGASSGMGEATALLLSKDHNLILNGRDKTRLETVAEKCKQYGNKVEIFQFDLVNAQNVAAELSSFLLNKGITVDSFLHFAGITEVLPIAKTKYSVGLEVMNVNYFSATEIISTLLKKKANQKQLKSIVLTSSIISEGGKKYQPHYCSSKGAINSLAKALACELAPDVRVNVISPGSFNTRIIKTLFSSEDTSSQWNPPTLLKPGNVDEVAKIARFLISEDSSYLTGQILCVDGGEQFPKY